jgi:hypothetical protein
MALPKIKKTLPLKYPKTLLPRREQIKDMITQDVLTFLSHYFMRIWIVDF